MNPALLLLAILAQDPAPSPTAPPPSPEAAAPASPSPEATAAPAAGAVRVAGRDVAWPKRTKSVTPVYPAEAQAVGQRGIVIVRLLVGPDGKVQSAEVVRSVPPFDEPALAAVRQWEYEITRVDGQPVPVELTLPITFAMRLPNVAREPGVPEMRQGVPPPFPEGGAPRQPVTATAELTLGPDGQVNEAAITGGEPPYTEALLQAVRTWAFVPLANAAGASLNVEAVFSGGKEGPRVQLRLYGLREVASVAAPARPSPVSGPAGADVAPASTLPDAPRPAPPAPVSGPAPAVARAPAAARPRTGGQAGQDAAVEIVPGPPPARPTDTSVMTPGVSAVRDVTLADGVPDLTTGRRPLVPPLARMEGVTGQIEVRFVVEASGATSNLEVTGPERLKEAARQTVSSWTFRRTSTERLFLVATIDYGAEAARAAVKRHGG
jgi:TonB family protein